MLKTLITAFVLLCALSVNSEASQLHKATGLHPDCNKINLPCEKPYASTPRQARTARGLYIRSQLGFGGPRDAAPVRPAKARRGLSVSGLVAPLAAKVAEIQASCGSRVISAIRHTRIAGTRHMSLHASGQAVDMQGNPGCMYGLLRDWPGGVSVDYARMAHVHISYGGREAGLRFRHGGHRHARRHYRNSYASAR